MDILKLRASTRITPGIHSLFLSIFDQGDREYDSAVFVDQLTIDHRTLKDRTVTLRDRDSLAQVRVSIAELGDLLELRLREPWRSPKLH